MLEFTGIATVLRGISVLYWLLACGSIALALWKGRGWRSKTLWTAIAVVVFGYLPGKEIVEQSKRDAYAREAWAYFRKKCETEAGEKIYRGLAGVKSVVVTKPLPPATERDLFDQYWLGDPYSNATPTSTRAEAAAALLAWPEGPISPSERGRGFDFVESPVPVRSGTSEKLVRYSYEQGARDHTAEEIEKPVSRFAVLWEDISTSSDRKYWVAGSRLRVIDLDDNTIVAERIGFLIEAGFGSTAGGRRPWLTARGLGKNGRSCPDTHTYTDRWFLVKALKPDQTAGDGKQRDWAFAAIRKLACSGV